MLFVRPQSIADLFEQAKVHHCSMITAKKVLTDAQDLFQKSRKELHNRLALIMHREINQCHHLRLLYRRDMLLESDESEKETFLFTLIEAMIDVVFREKEEVTFLLIPIAVEAFAGEEFTKMINNVQKSLPVSVLADSKRDRVVVTSNQITPA